MAAKKERSKSSRDAYGASGESKVLFITPDKLVLVTDKKHPLYDPRVDLPVDEALVLSIMDVGVLEPALIHKNSENGDIEVVDGRQRVKATLEANKRLRKAQKPSVSVPCLVRRGTDVELLGVSGSTFIRQDDTPLGKATRARRLMEMGRSEVQVAVSLGCTPSTIKNLLGLLDAPVAVRNAVESGKIAASTGYQLAKAPPGEQKKRLAEVLEKAPRTPGKKHSKGGGKARAIASGKKHKPAKAAKEAAAELEETGGLVGIRTMRQIKKMAHTIAESDMGGQDKNVADKVFEWIFGDNHAFDEWLNKDGKKDSEPPDSEDGPDLGD